MKPTLAIIACCSRLSGLPLLQQLIAEQRSDSQSYRVRLTKTERKYLHSFRSDRYRNGKSY